MDQKGSEYMKTAIITGITGQDGAYLAKLLIEKDYQVYGWVRNDHPEKLEKLKSLAILDKVILKKVDLLNHASIVDELMKVSPNEIYNLAAQSSVGKSFTEPKETLDFNMNSVLNLLEAIHSVNPKIRFYQASSSDMFGKINSLPITENHALNPVSPYATSKAAAHFMVRNYRDSYHLFAVSGILFNHESFLRGENFFVKKVIRQSIEISKGQRSVLEVGNIDVKRDFGYSPIYVEAMWKMLQIDKPEDFIICSGQSIYLRDIIYYCFDKLNISYDCLKINPKFYRPEEIVDIYGDNSKAKSLLGWNYEMKFEEVLNILIQQELESFEKEII